MSPKAPIDLPIIDFSKFELNPGSNTEDQWDSVKSQVLKAAEEYGCFKVMSTKISSELKNAIMSNLEELFALPLETKMNNTSEVPNAGYIGKTPFTPLFESLGIVDPVNLANVESLANALWPEGNPSFSKNIQCYSEQVLEIEKIIRRMVVEGLGLEKYFDEHLNSSDSCIRVIKYECPKTTEAEIGLAAHTDHGMIAILYQNQVDGLEVETKTGEWIDVKLEPDQFIVIIGESFLAWTNGRIYAPNHRVTMAGKDVRYSVGTFTAFKAGYIVKAPVELVDEEHPLLYKPFDFLEVLKRHQEEAQKSSENPEKAFAPLKAYYGA